MRGALVFVAAVAAHHKLAAENANHSARRLVSFRFFDGSFIFRNCSGIFIFRRRSGNLIFVHKPPADETADGND